MGFLDGLKRKPKLDGVERRAYHFVGYVQHRGFRYLCANCAKKAGVTGWVRNEDDGSVRCEAQGTPVQLDDFLARLMYVVDGIGDSWSVGSQETIDAVPGEHSFHVVSW